MGGNLPLLRDVQQLKPFQLQGGFAQTPVIGSRSALAMGLSPPKLKSWLRPCPCAAFKKFGEAKRDTLQCSGRICPRCRNPSYAIDWSFQTLFKFNKSISFTLMNDVTFAVYHNDNITVFVAAYS